MESPLCCPSSNKQALEFYQREKCGTKQPSSSSLMTAGTSIMIEFTSNNDKNGAIVRHLVPTRSLLSTDRQPKRQKALWKSLRNSINKKKRNVLSRSEKLFKSKSERNKLTPSERLTKSKETGNLFRNGVQSERHILTVTQSDSKSRQNKWLSSFRRLDPRYQILEFFNDVAREGADRIEEAGFTINTRVNSSFILDLFPKAAAFSVWRPTSNDAIQKMMKGEGTGKGLDVKGKSAKKGILSGFIPFLQIHEEKHKSMVRWPPRDGMIRIYYKSKDARNRAAMELTSVSKEMETTITEAKAIISKPCPNEVEYNKALENIMFDVLDSEVHELDNYTHNFDNPSFGIAVAQRIFFETYITRQKIIRDSNYNTGRPSEPAFQDMNFECTRNYEGSGPRAVVLQLSENTDDALCPQNLVVAYEEHGKVTPVVSDFDCFLVGTRNINYETPLSIEQVDLLKWLLAQIETILDSPITSKSWTSRWLDVLKDSADRGFYPVIPEFGFGDPKSYAIMKDAAMRFSKNGSVRHGAECFNYFFPQELDDSFLVISESVGRNGCKVPWTYVNAQELQGLLCKKIEDGFTFPLNPKWILSNPGWKAVYDKMMSSDNESIQKSLAVWYPPESGIREVIERVCRRFPDGFKRMALGNTSEVINNNGTEAMDLAEQQLRRHLILRRAKFKLRCVICLMNITK